MKKNITGKIILWSIILCVAIALPIVFTLLKFLPWLGWLLFSVLVLIDTLLIWLTFWVGKRVILNLRWLLPATLLCTSEF